MSKGRFYTPHQKGIIKRYYENKEDLAYQALSEIVSDLYLADSKRKQSLWGRVEKALSNVGTSKEKTAELMKAGARVRRQSRDFRRREWRAVPG